MQASDFFLLIGAVLIGLGMGGSAAYFAFRKRAGRARNDALTEAEIKAAQLNERVSRIPLLEAELSEKSRKLLDETNRTAKMSEQVSHLARVEEERRQAATHCKELEQGCAELREKLAGVEAKFASEKEKLIFQEQGKRQMSDMFQALANEILEQKTARFTEQNKTNIEQILGPLKTKITEFQDQVGKMSAEHSSGTAVLGEQVKQLASLNHQLSGDAKNLTNALKGSSKTQGNWGEMILERVLEASGLQKGREYELRESYERDNGRRGQPDVVINLPQNRHLVIDAKVSLLDYDLSVNAADDASREACAGRHVQSVRRHVKLLSEQNYQDLHQLKTVDFVIMFVPIEPAYVAAISTDATLWETSLKKNVLLVSPSVLFSVLRTVAVLWQQEKQAQHVKAIARRGGELYNKLVGFVEEFEKIGKSLDQTRKSFDDARRKLCDGNGNLVRQAQMLKQLGVRTNKSLPQGMIEEAMQETLPELEEPDLDEPELDGSKFDESEISKIADSPEAKVTLPADESLGEEVPVEQPERSVA